MLFLLDRKLLMLGTKVNTNFFKISTISECNVEDGLFSFKDSMEIPYGQVRTNKLPMLLQF